MNIPVRTKHGERVYTVVSEVDAHLSRYSWKMKGGYAVRRVYAGKRKHGHRRGESFQREEFMHRIIMGMSKGDGLQVDHVNRNPLDNRRENLRVVTAAQNAQNQGAHKRWTKSGKDSGIRGVHWDKSAGRWKAVVVFNKVKHSLGYFDRAEDAAPIVAEWRRAHMSYTVEPLAGGMPL